MSTFTMLPQGERYPYAVTFKNRAFPSRFRGDTGFPALYNIEIIRSSLIPYNFRPRNLILPYFHVIFWAE